MEEEQPQIVRPTENMEIYDKTPIKNTEEQDTTPIKDKVDEYLSTKKHDQTKENHGQLNQLIENIISLEIGDSAFFKENEDEKVMNNDYSMNEESMKSTNHVDPETYYSTETNLKILELIYNFTFQLNNVKLIKNYFSKLFFALQKNGLDECIQDLRAAFFLIFMDMDFKFEEQTDHVGMIEGVKTKLNELIKLFDEVKAKFRKLEKGLIRRKKKEENNIKALKLSNDEVERHKLTFRAEVNELKEKIDSKEKIIGEFTSLVCFLKNIVKANNINFNSEESIKQFVQETKNEFIRLKEENSKILMENSLLKNKIVQCENENKKIIEQLDIFRGFANEEKQRTESRVGMIEEKQKQYKEEIGKLVLKMNYLKDKIVSKNKIILQQKSMIESMQNFKLNKEIGPIEDIRKKIEEIRSKIKEERSINRKLQMENDLKGYEKLLEDFKSLRL